MTGDNATMMGGNMTAGNMTGGSTGSRTYIEIEDSLFLLDLKSEKNVSQLSI